MWISLVTVREKENMIRGKAKVSPKAKITGRLVGPIRPILPRTHGVNNLGINSHGISSHGKRIQMISGVKEKARNAKTKTKAKVIKVSVVKLPMLSPMLGTKSSNLQQHLVINLNHKALRCSRRQYLPDRYCTVDSWSI